MSILVREIEYNGRKEHMLYYPGMTKQEAQHLADQINGGMLAKRDPLSVDEIRDCAESENLPYFENKEEFDAFARSIEAAHNIGVNHE